MKNILLFMLVLFPISMFSQEKITGMIMEANDKNEHIGLAGANVYWLQTTIGTVTNKDGMFSIPFSKENTKLVISYVGFKTDTLTILQPKMVHHWLQPVDDLDVVTITSRKQKPAAWTWMLMPIALR